jgi:HKD family nuclease
MTFAIRRLFHRQLSVFWATTYECDVVAFDEYFLGQLRPDALNATILADHRALSEAWNALIDTGQIARLRRINRDYLLRPVSWHGQSFHPKTYLFANEQGGTLLVGSGNATLTGLVNGHEVFSTFRSSDPVGLSATCHWRDWMDQLVALLDEQLVKSRWLDAKARLPWLRATKPGERSPFVSNFETPLIEQFLDGLGDRVTELHVSAPFWDERLAALSRLLDATRPGSVHIYLGKGSKIDGSGLRRLLEERAVDARLWTYSEPHFVHAKLVAALEGDTGRLLSGSANLSYVALLANAGAGNVEAGVLHDADAAAVRSLFQPADLELVPLAPEELEQYRRDESKPEAAYPYRLLRAERLPDGHLSLATEPVPPDDTFVSGVGLGLAALPLTIVAPDHSTTLYRHLARARTVTAWESTAVLIELVNAGGKPISNRVPIDDPVALEAVLRKREERDQGALSELEWDELETPVGRILQDLQASCFFEPRKARDKRNLAVQREILAEGDSSFWERQGKLDLEAAALNQRSRFARGHLDTDPMFAQLRAMLLQAPYLPELRAIRPEPVGDASEEEDPEAAHRRWSIDTRRRVRIFNVLKRWCRAVRDPQLLALDPMFCVHNYRALLQALGELWWGDGEGGRYFDDDHLHALLRELLESLVGEGTDKGLFRVVDDATRERLVADLREHGATDNVAVLLYDALRPERRDRIRLVLQWQTLLIPALAYGVVEPLQKEFLAELQWVAEFVDEAGWCQRIKHHYGVEVEFSDKREKLGPGYEFTLSIKGLQGLLTDPRAPQIVASLLKFRPCTGFVLALTGSEDRISFRDGGHVSAKVGGVRLKSPTTIEVARLAALPQGASLSVLFDRTADARDTG